MLHNTTLEMVKMNSNPTKTTKEVRGRSPSSVLFVDKKIREAVRGNAQLEHQAAWKGSQTKSK
jgi:hypothetical protein